MKAANFLASAVFVVAFHAAGSAFAQEVDVRSISLVRQDFSDCNNADVSAKDPSRVGGTAIVERRSGGSGRVLVSLGAQPNTTYHFFLKCIRRLGDLTTDLDGFGSAIFQFGTGETADISAFDMYPEGAPPGNKYQSVQVNFRAPPVAVPSRIEYVGQVGKRVSFAYEGIPRGSEVAVVNSTFGDPIVTSTYGLSPLGTGFTDITMAAAGTYYLLVRGQADKNYIAQTVEFYID
jgi:hypothetical protein